MTTLQKKPISSSVAMQIARVLKYFFFTLRNAGKNVFVNLKQEFEFEGSRVVGFGLCVHGVSREYVGLSEDQVKCMVMIMA